MDYSKLISADDCDPIYQQIIRHLASWVQEGHLLPGDKLPTERQLAAQLQVSRGTISRAYEHLERMRVVESTPGRGTVISQRQAVAVGSRKDRAVQLLQDTYRELFRLRFSADEVRSLAQLVLMEMASRQGVVHAAAIDCNPESLDVLQERLRYIGHLELHPCDLHRTLADRQRETTLDAFDLIITTATHGIEVETALPALRERVVKVPMDPARQTIIDLSGIAAEARIGVYCESERFFGIIGRHLASFSLSPAVRIRPGTDALAGLDIVILSPSDPSGAGAGLVHELARFKEAGGRCLVFDFQTDRGTLSYLEERVRHILEERA